MLIACSGTTQGVADARIDASSDIGGVCRLGSTLCSGSCVSLAADDLNCGACGTNCGEHGRCVNGACVCNMHATRCGGRCVSTRIDPASCGACDRACSDGQMCMEGRCVNECPLPRVACGGGCVNAANDVWHCGRCFNPCPTSATCQSGVCVCPAPLIDCGTACVNITTDPRNCGACGAICDLAHTSASCVGATCQVRRCEDGWIDCNGRPSDGCEAQLSNDSQNCGACGRVCPTGTMCCAAECVNTVVDPTNCGACMRSCTIARGTAGCARGMCTVAACAIGFGNCDGEPSNGCEIALNVSTSNCGACGHVCTVAHGTSTCISGACAVAACEMGFADCDRIASNGCETNLLDDVRNCRACSAPCAAGEYCSNGTCTRQRSCASGTCGCGSVVIRAGTVSLVPGVNITLSDYRIDSYEVTVQRFRQFWNAGHPVATNTLYPGSTPGSTRTLAAGRGAIEPSSQYQDTWTRSEVAANNCRPITGVDWYTAQAFCVWDGGRLPTSAEWTFIARNRGRYRFPWGDRVPTSCTDNLAQWNSCAGVGAVEVGRFPLGAVDGIYDLAGNITEWVTDTDNSCTYSSGAVNPLCWSGPDSSHVLHGGSWIRLVATEIAAESTWLNPAALRGDQDGFRCVRSP